MPHRCPGEFHQSCGLISFHLAMGKRKKKLFLVLQNGVLNLPHHASVTEEKQFLVLQNGFLYLPRACFNEPKSFIRILDRHSLLSSGNGKRTRMKHFDEPKSFIRIVIHVPSFIWQWKKKKNETVPSITERSLVEIASSMLR